MPVNPSALLGSVFDLLDSDPTVSGIGLTREVPAGLPAVLGDANQLHHVLTNLILNARQALHDTPTPRQIRVTAATAGLMLKIGVIDNGPGIADAIRGRIFEPFFTTKKPGAGTGIGLAVARGIVEAHGGTLTLAPPSGRGAHFVLKLPLAP